MPKMKCYHVASEMYYPDDPDGVFYVSLSRRAYDAKDAKAGMRKENDATGAVTTRMAIKGTKEYDAITHASEWRPFRRPKKGDQT